MSNGSERTPERCVHAPDGPDLAGTREPTSWKERALAAEVEVLREQLAAAEAVIEQLRNEANAIIDTTRTNGTDFERGQENVSERVFDVLSVHPSSVLADALADAWDKGFGACDVWSSSSPGVPAPVNPHRTGDTNA